MIKIVILAKPIESGIVRSAVTWPEAWLLNI